VIDLHNHILPGLDDGAADVEESLAIARTFVSEGVTAVTATPHVNPMRGTGPSPERVRHEVELIQRAIDGADIPFQVQPGSEILLTPEVPELLRAGRMTTLDGTAAVLVELPFEQRPLYAERTLSALLDAGYCPVLAHPERYGYFAGDLDGLLVLQSYGVVLQLTAPSLAGGHGPGVRRAAQTLLREGAYGVAGSDRHHPEQQRSLAVMRERLNEMAEGLGDILLAENPGRLLRGERLVEVEPVTDQPGFLSRLFRV
jgi:protein-tyrosine phosphatase